jgi:hypothetical protein
MSQEQIDPNVFVADENKYPMLKGFSVSKELIQDMKCISGLDTKTELFWILFTDRLYRVYGSEYLDMSQLANLWSQITCFLNDLESMAVSKSVDTKTSSPEEETAMAAWQKKHAHMSQQDMREKWYQDGYKLGFQTAENEAKVKQQPHLQAMYQSGWLEGRAALRREEKQAIDDIIIKQVEAHRTQQQAYIENLLKEKANKNFGQMNPCSEIVIDTEEKLIQHFGQIPTANNSLSDAIKAKWEPILQQDYDMKFNIERVEVNSKTRELKDAPIYDASTFKVSPGVTAREHD